jgi:galactose mutarotase-like enzyme
MNISFKGEDAIVLSSESYDVTILPERGAKIASILYKPRNLELLSQLPEPKYQAKPDPSVGFTSEDGTGFDDMFPSILPGEYLWESGKVTDIHDHGNVWYRSWSYQIISERECLCSVDIPEFSCLLEKSIRINGTGIQVAYALTNNSEEPFNGLWAAHILFAMREGMFMQIDSPSVEIINAMENSLLGKHSFGKRYTYATQSEEWKALATFDSRSRSYAKYYFSNPSGISHCSLRDEQNDVTIRIDFDPEITPYLGIWKNERGWGDQMNVGIEPATSGMDAPGLAEEFDMRTTFPANEVTVWDLRISCV